MKNGINKGENVKEKEETGKKEGERKEVNSRKQNYEKYIHQQCWEQGKNIEIWLEGWIMFFFWGGGERKRHFVFRLND